MYADRAPPRLVSRMSGASPVSSSADQPSRLSQLCGLMWTGVAKSGEILKWSAVKGGQLAYEGASASKQFVQAHPKATAIGGGAAVSVALAPVALSAAGFGVSGVIAGSPATVVQSYFYGAWTSGLFSSLTSAGAAGIGVKGAVVAGAAGATGGTAIASKL